MDRAVKDDVTDTPRRRVGAGCRGGRATTSALPISWRGHLARVSRGRPRPRAAIAALILLSILFFTATPAHCVGADKTHCVGADKPHAAMPGMVGSTATGREAIGLGLAASVSSPADAVNGVLSGFGALSTSGATLALFSPLLADSGPSWGSIVGGVMVWTITTIASWLISSRVAHAKTDEKIASIAASVAELSEAVKHNAKMAQRNADDLAAARLERQKQLDDARAERSTMELRAAKTYATREEFTQMFGQMMACHQKEIERIDEIAKDFHASNGRVHSRIDDLANLVARLDERSKK